MKKTLLLFLVCIVSICLIAQPSKVAFVSTFATLNDLQNNGDDDEFAAANWLVNTYGGVFVPVSQIKDNTVDLSDYKVLWIHFDRQSDETTINNEFAAAFLDADVKTAISDFYKAGGNLLLSIYATRYLVDLGRYDLAVELKGFGNGGDNPDVWYVSPTWGTFVGAPEVFNRFTDPIYDDMTNVSYVTKDNGNIYPSVPLIGSGWKEDHNYFWNPQPDKANNDKYKIIDFENVWLTNSLGTWGHVQDYFGSGITRWNAKNEFAGKAITFGLAAYEWNQNSGTNIYQSNIEQLTQNALDELSPMGGTTATFNLVESGIKIIIEKEIIRFENIAINTTANIYSISGNLIQSISLNESNRQINVNTLSKGLYLIAMNDGTVKTTFKFIR